ncbi:TPA: prophage tail fiber N-terminal domain-containing protein [Klebsiella aerogenes]|nr:prophage tail fiber N-terminal domain-containing protein [Klebsiella aerogenes]
MTALTISGVLQRPISGDVLPNARIVFDAIATGTVVLKGVSSSCKTAADGSYSVDLEYGDYAVQVSWSGQTQQYGTIHIDDTTPSGSLNYMLLQQVVESELTPDILIEFRELQQEMQSDLAEMTSLNEEASSSASSAAASATAASNSEANAAGSETAAAASASAASTSETNAAGSETAAAGSAKAASTSETNAAASETAAGNSAAAASTSEKNAAASATAAANSASAASTSETNAATSAAAAASSATAASTSETKASASEEAASASEINAAAARDAAEEYAQEAKGAASTVTAPMTDQGVWTIQAGYPTTPTVASMWQITDGGVDPVNAEIIWDPGDFLIYLASADTWCRLLGQQVVSGEPVALTFDADIILNEGSGLQIITSGTVAVDALRLDSDNYLIVGNDTVPGVCLKAASPTNMFVMVPDGSGGYTKSRIYTEQNVPTAEDVGALPTSGGAMAGGIDFNSGTFTGEQAFFRNAANSITDVYTVLKVVSSNWNKIGYLDYSAVIYGRARIYFYGSNGHASGATAGQFGECVVDIIGGSGINASPAISIIETYDSGKAIVDVKVVKETDGTYSLWVEFASSTGSLYVKAESNAAGFLYLYDSITYQSSAPTNAVTNIVVNHYRTILDNSVDPSTITNLEISDSLTVSDISGESIAIHPGDTSTSSELPYLQMDAADDTVTLGLYSADGSSIGSIAAEDQSGLILSSPYAINFKASGDTMPVQLNLKGGGLAINCNGMTINSTNNDDGATEHYGNFIIRGWGEYGYWLETLTLGEVEVLSLDLMDNLLLGSNTSQIINCICSQLQVNGTSIATSAETQALAAREQALREFNTVLFNSVASTLSGDALAELVNARDSFEARMAELNA